MADIDMVAKLNDEISKLKKELDKYKAEIKADGEGTYDGLNYSAIVSIRETQKLDADKATEVAKNNGLKWILKTTIDENILEDEIALGHIDGKLFADCINTTKTQVIKFVKRKK